MTQPDVVVVGAGPSGCVAALVLARAGVKVCLLDRALFPREKLCGDTLNPGALSILDRLGGIGDRVRGRALPISGMIVTGPGGAVVASDYPHNLRGASIRRCDLDTILLEVAVAAGADFRAGVHVLEPLMSATRADVIGVRGAAARELRVDAQVVIAADGRGSKLALALGLARFAAAPKRWAFGAYFTGVDGLTARGEMHVRADGYVGVAPLPDQLTNVCIVRERRQALPADCGRADDVVAAAIDRDPALRARFARARRVSPVASLGPLAIEARHSGCPGLLLAGDASGFIDPMTGDGLRFAFRGGELAATAALEELASGVPAFERLRAARAREFGGKWRVNRAIRSLVGSPGGIQFAACLAEYWPAPVRALIGVAGDVRLAQRPTE